MQLGRAGTLTQENRDLVGFTDECGSDSDDRSYGESLDDSDDKRLVVPLANARHLLQIL